MAHARTATGRRIRRFERGAKPNPNIIPFTQNRRANRLLQKEFPGIGELETQKDFDDFIKSGEKEKRKLKRARFNKSVRGSKMERR